MQNLDLTGYPTGDESQWRARYEPAIESERGAPVQDAVVTAVVVTWQGGAAEVGACLEAIQTAIANFDGSVEVIVVDNAGPATLADQHSALWDRWIRFKENLRLNPARNLGVIAASADLVAFIDDDGLVETDYFTAALPYFDNPDIAAIRGRVVARNHPYFTTLATHYDRGPKPIDDALVAEGASFIRRQAFIDAGGLPDEVCGHEGIELTYRMGRQQTGARGRVLYVPDVVLRHDYLDSWDAFLTKILGYAGSEEEIHQRSPEVAEYLNEFFARSFPKSKLPIKKFVARTGLRALRSALQGSARVYHRISRTSRKN